MSITPKFKKQAAALGMATLPLGACAGAPNLSPQISENSARAMTREDPINPYAAALRAVAISFNERFPDDRLAVAGFKDNSGKFSERFGYYMPQNPEVMVNTILTDAGFRVAARDTETWNLAVRERNAVDKGLVDRFGITRDEKGKKTDLFADKMAAATISFNGGISYVEFNVNSQAVEAGAGPVSFGIQNGNGKLVLDMHADDLTSGTRILADDCHATFSTPEGGPNVAADTETSVLGIDNALFKFGFQYGQSPSLGDLARTCMTESLYSIMGPLVQKDFRIAEHFVGDQEFSPEKFENLRRLQDQGKLPPAPSLPSKVEELYGAENNNDPKPGS